MLKSTFCSKLLNNKRKKYKKCRRKNRYTDQYCTCKLSCLGSKIHMYSKSTQTFSKTAARSMCLGWTETSRSNWWIRLWPLTSTALSSSVSWWHCSSKYFGTSRPSGENYYDFFLFYRCVIVFSVHVAMFCFIWFDFSIHLNSSASTLTMSKDCYVQQDVFHPRATQIEPFIMLIHYASKWCEDEHCKPSDETQEVYFGHSDWVLLQSHVNNQIFPPSN